MKYDASIVVTAIKQVSYKAIEETVEYSIKIR